MNTPKYLTAFLLLFSTVLYAQQPPNVVSIFPNSQTINADKNTDITISFDAAIDPQSVNNSTAKVFGRWSGPMPGNFLLENGNTQIRFTPSESFIAGEWVTVSFTKSIMSAAGAPLATAYIWNFWIKTSQGVLNQTVVDTIFVREPGEGHIQTYGAYAGDINNDGWSDLAVVNETSSDVRLFLNDGSGNYANFTIYPMPANTRASTNEGGDFNGDGKIDFAVGYQNTVPAGNLGVFMGDGSGGFLPVTSLSASGDVRALEVIDINGDGFTDIIMAHRFANNLSVLLNNGDGTFAAPNPIEANGQGEYACSVTDANNDGIQDVFVGTFDSREVILLLGDGNGGLTFSDKVDATGRPWMMAIGDVNGDGFADVVYSGNSNVSAENAVGVVLSDGQGGLQNPAEYFYGYFPLAIDLGDLDGDGDLDMVASNYISNNYTVFENAGDGSFINPIFLQGSTNPSCAILHDRDNDGDLDITGSDETDDVMILFENTGSVGIRPGASKLPEAFHLYQNYPNPFNPSTFIRYNLAKPSNISIKIFDKLGQEVAELHSGKQSAGDHQIRWDGKNSNGLQVASGVYFVRLTADGLAKSIKITHIK